MAGTQVPSDHPGILGRTVARLPGEVPATDLEVYRRAGSEVFSLLGDLEQRRGGLAAGEDQRLDG